MRYVKVMLGTPTALGAPPVTAMLQKLIQVGEEMDRQPDKLKAAINLFTPFAIESSIMGV